MRVCIISSRFFPQIVGSGTCAYMIASQLAKREHEVTVLTDGTLEKLHTTLDMPFKVGYIPRLEKYALGSNGMREPLEALYEHLANQAFDVIHVCNFMPMLLINILRPHLDAPIVFSFFNTPFAGKRVIGYSSVNEVDTSLAVHAIKDRSYSKLILGSQHYVDTALNLGALKEDIVHCSLGIETELLNQENKRNASSLYDKFFNQKLVKRDQYVILPSRAVKQKGIIEAIRALAIVHSNGHKLKLLLTGMAQPFDIVYAEKVRSLVKELGLADYVIVPEFSIPRSELSQFISDATCVIVPSYFEGLGMAAIEAQIIGTPLIASNTVGLDEVVENQHNGLTCIPGNPSSLAGCILDVLNNDNLAKKLVRNGKKTSEKYSSDTFADVIETTYKELTTSPTL